MPQAQAVPSRRMRSRNRRRVRRLASGRLHYNYYRDYDPQTGRYVESDPIGLRAGINTYAYVRNDPVGSSDRSGLLSIRSSCKNFRAAIEAAERAIQANTGKCFQCTRDGSSSCIDCQYAASLAAVLASASVDCEPSLDINGSCGSGLVGSPGLTLTAILNPASRCARGGCIAETIVHELMHNIGLSHSTNQGAFDIERQKCTGALCKR
jgi:RHS repeat-associated protein